MLYLLMPTYLHTHCYQLFGPSGPVYENASVQVVRGLVRKINLVCSNIFYSPVDTATAPVYMSHVRVPDGVV